MTWLICTKSEMKSIYPRFKPSCHLNNEKVPTERLQSSKGPNVCGILPIGRGFLSFVVSGRTELTCWRTELSPALWCYKMRCQGWKRHKEARK